LDTAAVLTPKVEEKTVSARKQCRSKIEVYADILRSLGSGERCPSQIMQKANISWKVFKESSETLLSKGMIEEFQENARARYALTSRGLVLLSKIVSLKEEMF
jgi:predicted transcriptional regulator